MKQKLLSALLCLAMVLTLLPVSAFAAEISFVPANLTAADNANPPAYGYATEYSVTSADSTITVKAAGLEKTTNTNDVTAYWVGVGITKQEGATYAWGFGEVPSDPAPEYNSVDREQTDNTNTYTTLYWSSDKSGEETWSETTGYISVKVNDQTTNYTVKFEVSVKEEPETFTVTFAAGEGATGTMTAVDNISGEYTLPACTFTAPDGKEFAGWQVGDDTTTVKAAGDKITVTANVTLTATWKDKAAEPSPAGLTFGKLPSDLTTLYEVEVSKLGDFEIKTSGTKVTVTGTANYVSMPKFNEAVPAEQSGHYLPIQIKGTKGATIVLTNKSDGAKDGKEMTFGDDGSFELAAWLDGERTADEGKSFTVKLGTTTYVVDFSEVTLLPQTAEGTKVEVSENEDGEEVVSVSKGDNAAQIPTDVDVSQYTVEVAPVAKDQIADTVETALPENTDEKVVTALKTAETAVEVTVKDENDDEVFTDEIPDGKMITIVISGLTADTTYQIFAIKADGTLVNYGSGTPTDGKISFKTSHLTTFVPVPVPADNAAADVKANFAAAVAAAGNVEIGSGLEGSPDTAPTTNITMTFADAASTIGKTVTIGGLSADTITVQIARGTAANPAAPAVVFTMGTTAAQTGKTATFRVNANSVVTVWDGEVTFSSAGVPTTNPDHLTKVAG